MRRYTALVTVVFLIPVVAGHGGSHSDLPEPDRIPGDMLYGLEKAQERISLALTFSEEAKAEKKLEFADERLAESLHAEETGRNESAAAAAKSYVELISEVNSTATESGNEELQEKVDRHLKRRAGPLEELQNNLPEQADRGLETALSTLRSTGKRSDTSGEQASSPTGGFMVTGGLSTN